MKKWVNELESAQGSGTSLISLLIPSSQGQLAKISALLKEELSAAMNIKSRVNRLSVQTAIKSTQQLLKKYNAIPANGLAIFVGLVSKDNDGGGKGNSMKKIAIDFEPVGQVKRSMYKCDSQFHVDDLKAMLVADQTSYGYVVIDGKECLFGLLNGSDKFVLKRFQVDLPNKCRRGGQSAARFGRARDLKRHHYLVRCCEVANQVFISLETNKLNVHGIFFCGSAELKQQMVRHDSLDQRVKNGVLQLVDTSYGGENGFHEAIQATLDKMVSVELMNEQRFVTEFFHRLAKDSDLACFGFDHLHFALQNGAVEHLIVHDSMRAQIVEIKRSGETTNTFKFMKEEGLATVQQIDQNETIVHQHDALEWFRVTATQCGAQLALVTNRTAQGDQFCAGFSGIGALLRWALPFDYLQKQQQQQQPRKHDDEEDDVGSVQSDSADIDWDAIGF